MDSLLSRHLYLRWGGQFAAYAALVTFFALVLKGVALPLIVLCHLPVLELFGHIFGADSEALFGYLLIFVLCGYYGFLGVILGSLFQHRGPNSNWVRTGFSPFVLTWVVNGGLSLLYLGYACSGTSC